MWVVDGGAGGALATPGKLLATQLAPPPSAPTNLPDWLRRLLNMEL